MKLIIPGILPSVNHMYKAIRIKGHASRALTDEAKVWMTDIIIQTIAWKNKTKWKTAEGKVFIRLWYYFPDHRKRDTHNTLKLLLDCFEDAGIYSNDRYALPQIMDFEIDKANPRVEIQFEVKEAG